MGIPEDLKKLLATQLEHADRLEAMERRQSLMIQQMFGTAHTSALMAEKADADLEDMIAWAKAAYPLENGDS